MLSATHCTANGCAWWCKFGADICGHAWQRQGPNHLQIILQVQVYLEAHVQLSKTQNNEIGSRPAYMFLHELIVLCTAGIRRCQHGHNSQLSMIILLHGRSLCTVCIKVGRV